MFWGWFLGLGFRVSGVGLRDSNLWLVHWLSDSSSPAMAG